MPRHSPLGNLLQALKVFATTQRRAFMTLAASHVVAGVLPAGMVWIAQRLADVLAAVLEGQQGGAHLYRWYVVWGVAAVLGPIIYLSSNHMIFLLQERLTGHFQAMLLKKTVNLPLLRLEQPATQDMIARSQESLSDEIMLDILMRTATVIPGLLSVGSLTALLWTYSPWLSLSLVVSSIPAVLLYLRRNKISQDLYRSRTEPEREKRYLETLMSDRSSAAELRAYGLTGYLMGLYLNLGVKVARLRLKHSLNQILTSLVSDLIKNLGFVAVTALATWYVAIGRVSFGQYAAVIVALEMFSTYVGQMIQDWGWLHQNGIRLADLFAVLKLPDPEFANRSGSSLFGGKATAPLIHLEKVSFQYPNLTEPTLKDLTFSIWPGQTVALVGENGAGKSTLTRLLLGLYEPTTGTIRTASGASVEKISRSAVFQDFMCYQLTVSDNIGFGDLPALGDETRIHRAAERAGVDRLVEPWPMRYKTMLGRLFEGGRELSGGEWQRIALARGAVADSDLLILDEPTSALDPLHELDILSRFHEVSRHRATVIVSHRLGVARLADIILVLHQGRLVERGTHEELLKADGLYARFWHAQAQWYQTHEMTGSKKATSS